MNTESNTPITDDLESRYDYSIFPHERHHSVNADDCRAIELRLNECVEALEGMTFDPNNLCFIIRAEKAIANSKKAI